VREKRKNRVTLRGAEEKTAKTVFTRAKKLTTNPKWLRRPMEWGTGEGGEVLEGKKDPPQNRVLLQRTLDQGDLQLRFSLEKTKKRIFFP